MILRFLFILLFSFCFAMVHSQVETETTRFFSPRYSLQLPQADMADRFGVNSSLGLTYGVKDSKDLFYGVNVNFLFGNNVKEPGLIRNLVNLNGVTAEGDSLFDIIGLENRPATVLIQQRGFNISADFGKFFKFKNSENQSGILATFGAGFMQHNIRFETQLDEVPQLEGDYEKGYDRLTNGLMISQNVGWMFLNKKFGGSFYLGIEAIQGFTQSRRTYNFDTMTSDLGVNRLDVQLGLKVAWIVPTNRRNI